MDQVQMQTLARDKSFQIKPSKQIRTSSLLPEFTVDFPLSQDPSEADFVMKLSTLRHERKTLTRTLRKKQEQSDRADAKKVFPRGNDDDEQSDNGRVGMRRASSSSKDLLLTVNDSALSKGASEDAHESSIDSEDGSKQLLRKKMSSQPGELRPKQSDLLKHRKSREVPPHESGDGPLPAGAGARKSTLGVPGDMELSRMSTYSDDFDDDERRERLHRRRSKSNPGVVGHSVKFELTEMDKMATGEYLSFDDLKRRQSVPGIPVHPHNYKQWLKKQESNLKSDAEDDEIDPDTVLQSLANQRGGYESASDSELEGDLKDSAGSKTATGSSMSLSTTGGDATRKGHIKPSPLNSSRTELSAGGKSSPGETSFFGFGRDKSKKKKTKRLQPVVENLYPWEHFSLQQAIMGANVFSLLAAFAVLFGVSAWSVSQLGQQTSSFVGNSTLEFVCGNITSQFHVAEEVLLDFESDVVLNNWSLSTSQPYIEHTLALLFDRSVAQTVGTIFYSEPQGASYIEFTIPYTTMVPQLGVVAGDIITYSSLDPQCSLTNASCPLALSTLFSAPGASTGSAQWNQTLEQAPNLSQVVLTSLYLLPSGSYGMVVAKGHPDPLAPQNLQFVLGATLEPLRLSASLLALRGYLQEGSTETDLFIFLVDSAGYLVGISLEKPSSYLFSSGGCPGGCRVAAVDSTVDGIGNVYATYLTQRDSSQEIVAGTYRGIVKLITFGGKRFDVVVSIKDGAFVSQFQTIQYAVIAVTFFVILVIILIAIRFVTQRLTRSVNKVSKMMVDMANLDLTYTPARESRRFHIKETERLVSAMEVMNVALRSFVKYVPQEVVRILVQENAEVIIGVDDSFLTIFFSDIEGFTTISELLEPDDLIQVMSEYLEEMSQIILDSSGVVDKYIGDAIMAFWNAPLSVPSHRAVACAVALRMQRRLRKLNSEWSTKGIPPIRARVGINAGIALVGNLGSPARMSYTCIGDCVNTASRLENLNKQYGTYLMISENIYQSKTVQENFLCRTLDKVCVKGKSQSLLVYELVCETKVATDEIKGQLKLFNDAFDLYQRREFPAAGRQFSRFLKINPDDKAAEVLKQRCKTFSKNPPHAEWDGSYIALEK